MKAEKNQIKNSRSIGVLLSYAAVLLTTAANFILIPFYMRTLGADAYGLYEYVYSIASYAMILDFGISSVMIRYISEYRMKKDKQAEENFIAHILLITLFAVLVIAVIGMGLFANIDHLIVNRTAQEMVIARRIFIFMLLRITLALLQHFFDGALLSYERYAQAKGIQCLRILTKLVFIILLVLFSKNIYGIVLGDVLASLVCLLISLVLTLRMSFRAHLYFLDKKILRDVFLLVFALIMQSIVIYVNTAMGKYIVGRSLNNAMVTVYAVALSMFEVFQTITVSVNPVFMPKVTQLITSGASKDNIVSFVIKVGRLQCILCLCIMGGFVAVGRNFLSIWSGKETVAAWLPTLLLMLSSILPLTQSTCLSALTVYNKRLFRSIVLLAIIPINIGISLLLIPHLGVLGVAMGSSIALLLGNGLVMNIYYQRVIGLNAWRMIKGIFSGILPAGACAAAIGFGVGVCIDHQGLSLLASGFAFCLSYALALYVFGLNRDEKRIAVTYMQRIRRKLFCGSLLSKR